MHNGFGSNKWRLTCFGILFLLLILLSCTNANTNDDDQIKLLSERFDACVIRIEELTTTVNTLSNNEIQLQQINATLQRLVGNLSPIQPHDEAVKKLLSLKEQIEVLQEKQVTKQIIANLNREYELILAGMPPLAQESMLQEIIALKWSIDALPFIIEQIDSEANSVDNLLGFQYILETKPNNSPEWIEEKLLVILETSKRDWITYLRENKIPDQIIFNDIEKALANLNLNPSERDHLILLLLELKEKDIGKLDHYRLKQPLAEDAYSSAISLRYSFQHNSNTSTNDLSKLEQLITNFEKVIENSVRMRQKIAERKFQQYQGWVLRQLDFFGRYSYVEALEDIRATFKLFEKPQKDMAWRLIVDYQEFKSAIEGISGQSLGTTNTLSAEYQKGIYENVYSVVGWKNDEDLARIAVREAMVKYLLPIDDRYLDPVVGKIFSKIYNESLSHLEGTDHYLYVAKKTVDVDKITPSDM